MLRRLALVGLTACSLLALPGTVDRAHGQGGPTLRVFVNGNGSVVGSGVNCGARGSACSVSYALGTTITIEAVPERYSVFSGWTGACTGISPTCTLPAGAPVTVTASFSYISVVDVNMVGDGRGTVTSEPQGIDCGTVCAVPFTGNTKVLLTAKAEPGSTFAGWSGSCVGTGTCELQQAYGTMAVYARFEPEKKTPTENNTKKNTDTGNKPTNKKTPPTTTTGKKAFVAKSAGARLQGSGASRAYLVRVHSTHAATAFFELYRGGTKVMKSRLVKINPGVLTVKVPLPPSLPAGGYQVYATIKSIEDTGVRQYNLKWVFTLR